MSPLFMSEFAKKTIVADAALELIQSNTRMVASMAAAEPVKLFEGLHRRVAKLKNVSLHCANPSQSYPCFTSTELAGHIDINVMFLTSSVRKVHGHGSVHYVPQHLSRWSTNLLGGGDIDIFWGSCTPPDERGFVSLGPGVCYESDVLRKAKLVILEVNKHLPYTYGATHVPVSWVHHFISSDHPLHTVAAETPNATDEKIAAHIAGLVPDGATIQLGIGGIPNAIGKALLTKKDLGVHTEMINDTVMDLYNAGVITGRHKTLWPGKIVGAFMLGSQTLYDFCNRNPVVELHPASVVNDPYRIGRNYKMFSINTAVEIDLTGQVCSESVGHRQLSGVGGATDTHIGAQRSAGGRGIVALHSTTQNDSESKIAFELKQGAKVSISRNDIDTVVTEFGVARLAGKSVSQRIHELVNIAHPKFRDELLHKAKAADYV